MKEAYPDHTQFEKNSPYYDPSSKEDNPKWSMVKSTYFSYFMRGKGWTKRGRKVCAVFRSRYTVQLLHPKEVTWLWG